MRVALVGLGLIGASLALALRRSGAEWRIAGWDRDAATVAKAREAGVIEDAFTFARAAAYDVVVLAIPVGQMRQAFEELAPRLGAHTLVTDTGSTKAAVIAAARAALGAHIARFVPGHPIAGREKSGLGARDASLFEGRNVVLTPLAENPGSARQAVERLWLATGACVTSMGAEEHDAVFGAVSHLPHAIAFALVAELAARPNARQLFGHAASGFRDFTRIAGSSPEMWRDIVLDNRAVLVGELDRIMTRLQCLRAAIATGDGQAIEQQFGVARAAREKWLAGELDHFRDEAV